MLINLIHDRLLSFFFFAAVVDTSSILEHREELRDLWEKRMMADENQSSSPSIAAETNSKPLLEEESEEKVSKGDSESNQHKMSNGLSNGFVKHSDVPDRNANHIRENPEQDIKEAKSMDADHENNNSADSLEEDNIEDYTQQKTYTSNLEQALVMTEVKEVSAEVTSETVAKVEKVSELQETTQLEIKVEELVTSTSELSIKVIETVEVQEIEESGAAVAEEQISSSEEKTGEIEPAKEAIQEAVSVSEESTSPAPVPKECKNKSDSISDKIVIPDVCEDDEGDGFVSVEECLPKDDNADEPLDLPGDQDEQNSIDHDVPSSNGKLIFRLIF